MILRSVTFSANGVGDPVFFKGGQAFCTAVGNGGSNFGGGTMTLQVSYGDASGPVTPFVSLGTDATKTADASFIAELPECWLRWALTGATTPTVIGQIAAQGKV